jgi:hypothetical protein
MPPRRAVAGLPRLLGVAALLVLLGCSGRRLSVPSLSPEEAGRQALAEYDQNQDGFLDARELQRCPALASCLSTLDKDKDGRLSGEEIAQRVRAYQTSRVGLAALAFQVTLDGQGLAGATVTFVPEKFLGPALPPASAVSDARGMVRLETPGAEVPGVACGLYRVEVSKKNAAGQETIPARYNRQSVLGVEVAPEGRRGPLHFALRGS